VHRRSATGCSFLADHSVCFLTYPTFQIEINSDADCTIPCRRLALTSGPFDFDSRTHNNIHSSDADVRMCHHLSFRAMQQSCLAGVKNLQKPTAHLEARKDTLPTCDADRASFPTIPVYAVSNSWVAGTERINSSELKKYFGCHSLNDWTYLEQTGTGLHVVQDAQGHLTLGDITTIARNNHDKLLQRPPKSLHTVGMDIGYGEGTSPGGYKYVLTLVDFATRYTWTYGLKNKTAKSVIDALWSFFVDAGGIPSRIRCDFDSSFVKGKVHAFLKVQRIQITSAPPQTPISEWFGGTPVANGRRDGSRHACQSEPTTLVLVLGAPGIRYPDESPPV
jgi:hypothetical protein